MTYYSIFKDTSVQHEEKKSLFMGHIKRIEKESDAKEFIGQIKGKHKEANHNVFAYIIGKKKNIQRYSDDGEPQGTAGIPVLEVLKKQDLTDVIIVVTRYFGGTLLGAGGLIRAYSKTASLAVQTAGIIIIVLGQSIKITLDYDLLGKIQYLCSTNKWHIENIDYSDKVILTLYAITADCNNITQAVIENTNGRCETHIGKEREFFSIDNKLYTNIP